MFLAGFQHSGTNQDLRRQLVSQRVSDPCELMKIIIKIMKFSRSVCTVSKSIVCSVCTWRFFRYSIGMNAIMFRLFYAYWVCTFKHMTYIRFVLHYAAPIRPSAGNAPFRGRNEHQSNSISPPDVGEFKKASCFKFVICASQFRCFVLPVEKERKIISNSWGLNMPNSSFFQTMVSFNY